jgi:hypothetical protein
MRGRAYEDDFIPERVPLLPFRSMRSFSTRRFGAAHARWPRQVALRAISSSLGAAATTTKIPLELGRTINL